MGPVGRIQELNFNLLQTNRVGLGPTETKHMIWTILFPEVLARLSRYESPSLHFPHD